MDKTSYLAYLKQEIEEAEKNLEQVKSQNPVFRWPRFVYGVLDTDSIPSNIRMLRYEIGSGPFVSQELKLEIDRYAERHKRLLERAFATFQMIEALDSEIDNNIDPYRKAWQEAVSEAERRLLDVQQKHESFLLGIASPCVDRCESVIHKSFGVALGRERLPSKIGGVYTLISVDGIEYVGQSGNIRKRITAAHQAYDPLRHFCVGYCQIEDNRERACSEAELILTIRPPLNRVGFSLEQHSLFMMDARY